MTLAPMGTGIQRRQSEAKDVGEEFIVYIPGQHQAQHAKALASRPIDEFQGRAFAHKQRDSVVPIERRNGKKIESSEQEIQQENDAKKRSGKSGYTRARRLR